MTVSCKSVQIGDSQVYNLNAIYSWVMVDVTDAFSYDPMSFHLSQPRCSRRMEWGFVNANVTIIDGSALLWTIHWPADGSVADFGVDVKTRITKYLTNSNVYNHQTPVRGIYKRIYKRDVIHQATCFISACYGKKSTTDMSNTRLFVGGGGGREGSLLLTRLVCSPTNKGGVH